MSVNQIITCDFRFTYIDVGAQGRASDGGVFSASSLEQAITSNTINIPQPRCPPSSDQPLPFVMLGDEAFPLKKYLLRPYPRRDLTNERKVSIAIKISVTQYKLTTFVNKKVK